MADDQQPSGRRRDDLEPRGRDPRGPVSSRGGAFGIQPRRGGGWPPRMAGSMETRIIELGTWREALRVPGGCGGFSPDGRLMFVTDNSLVIGLVEVATSRVLARFERPDLQPTSWSRFSSDGSRLLAVVNEPPSVQVIDLRPIRRRLAEMGLDWDAPAFSDDDPARADPAALAAARGRLRYLWPATSSTSRSSRRRWSPGTPRTADQAEAGRRRRLPPSGSCTWRKSNRAGAGRRRPVPGDPPPTR